MNLARLSYRSVLLTGITDDTQIATKIPTIIFIEFFLYYKKEFVNLVAVFCLHII